VSETRRVTPYSWHRLQEMRELIGMEIGRVSGKLAHELLDEIEKLTAELLERHEVLKQQGDQIAALTRRAEAAEARERVLREGLQRIIDGPCLEWCGTTTGAPCDCYDMQAHDALAQSQAPGSSDLSALRAERDRYKAALETIRRDFGHVCPELELCEHPACQSSVGAWLTADAALGETS
jgi:hypothetical protein